MSELLEARHEQGISQKPEEPQEASPVIADEHGKTQSPAIFQF